MITQIQFLSLSYIDDVLYGAEPFESLADNQWSCCVSIGAVTECGSTITDIRTVRVE